tara:strand:- start:5085 stop:5297 length:213 start_codon:yes stop_codon:yes gene_type:complete
LIAKTYEKTLFKSRQIVNLHGSGIFQPCFLTVKQRASLRSQRTKVIISRLWKPKKLKIKYDNLLDGRVSH